MTFKRFRQLSKRVVLCAALFSFFHANARVGFGKPELFNDGWLFTLSDTTQAYLPEMPDTAWRELSLPHDWSIEHHASPDLASGTGYLPGGVAWYRKHFSHHPTEEAGRKKYIYFEGVYNRSDVYVNGHHLGHRPSGYASFMYDITPWLREGDNVIAVKVDHSRYADSRYYTGSGIYRNVWLVDAPATHIAQWGTSYETTKVKNGIATVKVNVDVENPVKGLRIETSLIDAKGKTVARSSSRAGENNSFFLKVPEVSLWDIDSPYLYSLATRLILDGKEIDADTISAGLRTLDFNADAGFSLNGKNRKVKGVCIHHDAGSLGAAVPPEVWERRLKALKDIGVNALRMSHNPQAPVVYDIADRIGLLIMDEATDEWEFPKRKWIKGWNKGTPGFDGTYDYFDEWIERDVADMVRRDRRHPSVILWSIGNEVDYPNDPYSHPVLDGNNSSFTQPMYGGYQPDAPDAMRIGEIAKRLAAIVKQHDTSRPVTGALAGVVMSNQTAYPEAVDVVGYNYTESRYDEDHTTYPRRVIYGSENRSDYDAWKSVRDKDFIFGQFIWTGIDYLGESGEWPSRGLYTGLLDFTGKPKPRGMFRASLWKDEPFTYIGTYPKPRRGDWLSIDAPDTWNYEPGEVIRVVCYTNSPAARLLLDGKQIGETKEMNDSTGIIHWDIPYSPGKLTAQGIDANGDTVSEYSIVTSDLPYRIVARCDIDRFTKAGETAHVEIEIVDKDGVPVKLADNDISIRVTGGARLLATDSGDNSDMSRHNYKSEESDSNDHWRRAFQNHRQRAFRGRLIAYVKCTDPSQPVEITLSSPLLKSSKIAL